MQEIAAWSGLRLGARLTGGAKNEVWAGSIGDRDVVVRRSVRGAASLSWELDLIGRLDDEGFLVPTVVATDDGRSVVDGVVVQRWIDGRMPRTDDDWQLVADELQHLHRTMARHPQRPDCCTVAELVDVRRSVDADLDVMPNAVIDELVTVFAAFADVDTAVIHGDPGAPNIRITDDGRVGFLDWDESRVDVTWHDLSNLGVPVLEPSDHVRAERLSNAWEAANGWTAEPDYARRRLAALGD